MEPRKHILYLQLKNDGYDHAVCKGVAEYGRQHGHWILAYASPSGSTAEAMAEWHFGKTFQRSFDGVLFRGSDRDAVVKALRLGSCPVVEVQMRSVPPAFPCVSPDYFRAGEMAAEHLLELGFRNFGACVSMNLGYQRVRWEGFRHVLRRAGHEPELLDLSKAGKTGNGIQGRVDQLADWLRNRPRPLAMLFTWVPRDGRLVEACELAGLRIPEDVAVVVIGSDLISCDLVWPTLTTVDVNLREVGYRSAQLLDRLMRGEEPESPATLLPPLGIRPRMSTDVVAVEDECVAAALRRIRESCPHPLPVETLAAGVGVSRRKLEMRFREVMGRSPGQEMTRQRMEYAKRVLAETGDKAVSVALQCGYRSYNDFIRAFRNAEGITPAEYRDRCS